jgi:hypothetical protein
MKITDLNIQEGTKIKLYICRLSDDSGAIMGRGVEGNPLYLKEVIYRGPIYNGVMGQFDYLNGEHVGMMVSAHDVIAANPEYKK